MSQDLVTEFSDRRTVGDIDYFEQMITADFLKLLHKRFYTFGIDIKSRYGMTRSRKHFRNDTTHSIRATGDDNNLSHSNSSFDFLSSLAL
jgi:hypothetical protein